MSADEKQSFDKDVKIQLQKVIFHLTFSILHHLWFSLQEEKFWKWKNRSASSILECHQLMRSDPNFKTITCNFADWQALNF